VAENIEDSDAKGAFSWQLKKILAEMPPETINELKNIVSVKSSETHVTIATTGGVAITGDATGNVIITRNQNTDIDKVDLDILRVIADHPQLHPSHPQSYTNVDMIIACLSISSQELGARLGVLESKGFVNVLRDPIIPWISLPNGIYVARLTDLGFLRANKGK
jgi:hypothetical protein